MENRKIPFNVVFVQARREFNSYIEKLQTNGQIPNNVMEMILSEALLEFRKRSQEELAASYFNLFDSIKEKEVDENGDSDADLLS